MYYRVEYVVKTIISSDGSVIVGNSYSTETENRAFKYVDGTMTNLEALEGSKKWLHWYTTVLVVMAR